MIDFKLIESKLNYKLKMNQLLSFFAVGVVNTIVGYSFFAFFLFLDIHYTVAVFFATLIGIVFNFFSIGKVVFNNTKKSLIFRFLIVYIILYLINVIGLRISEILEFNLYISGAVLVFPLALISFYLNKNFVFKIENSK